MKKPNTSIVASAIALAAAVFTVPALAGNNVFKQGEADDDNDYLASNSANWGQASQVSTNADTGETTITEMSFAHPFVTTFDKLIKTTTYCWIGATDGAYDADDAWCVWRTKGNSSEYGFTQSGNNHVVMADASTQKGRLRIESGTYTAQTFQIGGNSGTAYLDVSNATLSATGDFRVASYNSGSTKGYVTLRGGATVTAGANIAIGTESGVTADVTVTNATLSATGVLYVGRSSGTGTLSVEKDATVHTDGDISVGSNGGTGTLVVDGGTVSSKYWLTAGRDAATTSRIEVHGGTLTTAYRDGAEQTGNTGNGMMDLASSANSKATFLQTGGRVHAAGSANNADKYIAMAVGNGTGAEAAVELTGGEMDLDGVLAVPRVGTGSFSMGGGELDVLSEVYIANGDNSVGTLTVTGGTANVHSFMQVGRGSGSTATFAMSNGTVNVNRYVAVGFGANSSAQVEVSGGTLNLDGNNENIGFLIGDNSTAVNSEIKVTGNGVVNGYGDCYVGWNSAGKLTIDEDGYVCVGTSSVHKWLKINNSTAVTGHSEINLDGGTLDVCHIRLIQPGDGSADVNFNGGTVNVYANNAAAGGNLFGNGSSGDLRVFVKANGATISVPFGVSVSVNEPLLTGVDEGTDGGFTKAGEGTLTLYSSAGNTYTGPTVVKGGSLVLPSGGTLASTQLVLDGGTFSGTAFDTVVIDSGIYMFSELPVSASGNVTLNGGILRMTAVEAAATEGVANVVVNGGTLLIDGSAAESIAVGTTLTFGNVTLGTGVAAGDVVKVGGVNFDWSYDSSDGHPTATAAAASGDNVWIGGASGNWSDAVNWSKGVPSDSLAALIDTDATIYFEANKTASSITINANVLFRKSAGDPEIRINDVDGTGTLSLYHVGFRGNGGDKRIGSASGNALTLEFVSTVSDGADSWLVDVSVYAPMTGAGYVRLYGGTRLYGDNSAFTGTVKKDDADVRFMSAQTGFPNASSITVDGTIWLWFDEGEIAFGGNFTAYATGNCGINLPGTVRAVTMTVGGGNGEVKFSRGWNSKNKVWFNYYSAFVDSNGWQQGSDKFTFRKIGSGAITEYGVDAVYNLQLEGGSVNFGAEKVYTGPDTRLTVANATLGVAAATTVASADFQSGSTLQSTYYETTEEETTTYGVNLLTVAGAATLNGLSLTAAGTTPNVDTTYTVLSASGISGTAVADIEDDDPRSSWYAKVRGNDLVLRWRLDKPGFMIIVQ